MIATVTLNPSLDEWMELPTLQSGRLNRATGFVRYPGGKGINVSRVVHELGGPTVAFALAGGKDGMMLRELMNSLQIPHEFETVDGPTRNNYKIRTTTPRALTEINTAGPRVTSANLRAFERRLFGHAPEPKCMAFSGSLPPGVPSAIYARWIRRLHRARIPAVLDASGAALRAGLQARPWLMKPNREEAQEALGRRLQTTRRVIDAAQEFVRRGCQIVMLSLGKDGALLAAASLDSVWHARSPAVKAVSAVGAGDSLIGGFLVGWYKRWPLLDAFRVGVACGTATVLSPGTELCHQADVRRLMPRVTITRVA